MTIETENVNTAQAGLIQQKLTLQAALKNGAGWFYWIAGLSILNSIIYLFGGSINFVVGLGITILVDVFAKEIAQSLGGSTLLLVIGFVINIAIAVVFIAFGVLGSKQHRWAIITGMVLYVLDAIIFIFAQDWLSVGFHAFALWGIFRGLQALNQLRLLEANGPILIPQGAVPFAASNSPAIGARNSNLATFMKIAIIGLVVIFAIFMVWLLLQG